MDNVLVVGYKGEIGSFILNGLLRELPKATNIYCVDVNDTLDEVAERIRRSETIFLCVPLDKTVAWIDMYAHRLKGKIIIEQCSLKEDVLEAVSKYDLDIRSMHILFRPSKTHNKEDRSVSIVGWDYEAWEPNCLTPLIKDITDSTLIFHDSAEEHDREMAINQALLHRTIMILRRLGNECQGQTFLSKRIREMDDRIRDGDLDLYRGIQGNRHLPEQLDRIKDMFADFDIDKVWRNQ